MACNDQITTQDLENAKDDATFLAEIANSKAGGESAGAPINTATNRFGEVTDTLQGRLNKLGVIYSDPIKDWSASLLVNQLEAHRYPATTGDIYIPTAPLPFTTGASFDTSKWQLLNGYSDSEINRVINQRNFDSATELKLASIEAGQFVETGGYYEKGGSGAGKYLVKTEAEALADGDVLDGYGNLQIANGNWVILQEPFDATTKQFGARGGAVTNAESFDDTAAIQAAIDIQHNPALGTGADYGEATTSKDRYAINNVVLDKVSFTGRSTFIPHQDANVLFTLGREQGGFWYREVNKIDLDGADNAGEYQAIGFDMADPIGGLNTRAGRWILNNVRIYRCSVGIRKEFGNISNAYNSLSVRDCDIGYKAKGRTDADPEFDVGMNSGSDIFNEGHMSGCISAAVYIDDDGINSGQHVFNNTIIEGNPGYGVYVKNYVNPVIPITFNGAWFEANAYGGDVTINGAVTSPVDVHLENCRSAIFNGCKFTSLRLVNSSAVLENMWLQAPQTFEFDQDSYIRVKSAHVNQWQGTRNITVESITDFGSPIGGDAATFMGLSKIDSGKFNRQGSAVFQDISDSPVDYIGTTAVSSNTISDGIVMGSAQLLTHPSGETLLHPSTFSTEVGKYYVTTLEVKVPQAAMEGGYTISIQGTGGTVMLTPSDLPLNGSWTTLCSIGQAETVITDSRVRFRNDTGGDVTVRLGVMQVMAFGEKQQALEYLNSRSLYTGS